MYYQKERAAKLLAAGDSIESVARTVKKEEETVKLWLIEPGFRQVLIDNVAGAALHAVISYLTGVSADKDRAMVALALLRMNKTAPTSPRRNGPRRDTEDETDIDGFTEEQLSRLEGNG